MRNRLVIEFEADWVPRPDPSWDGITVDGKAITFLEDDSPVRYYSVGTIVSATLTRADAVGGDVPAGTGTTI
jgi:hypothetical protein